MNVIWVEIPVQDIDRAAKFYGALFEQTLEPMAYDGRKFAMIEVADGEIGISLNQFPSFEPSSDGTLVYLNAGDAFDAMLTRIDEVGGKVVIPRSPMSETSVFATFHDTEGNTIGLYADV